MTRAEPAPGNAIRAIRVVALGILVFFFLLASLMLLVDPRPLIEGKIRKRFNACGSFDLKLQARPRAKIWLGRIDLLHLRVCEWQIKGLMIRDIQIEGRDIAVSPLSIIQRDLRGVKSAKMSAIIVLDERAIGAYLRSRTNLVRDLEVELVPERILIRCALGLPLVSVNLRLAGALRVEDLSKIYLEIPQESEGPKGKYLSALLDAVNPILDVQKIDLGSIVFARLDENERSRWKSQVKGLKVEKGQMEITIRMEKF